MKNIDVTTYDLVKHKGLYYFFSNEINALCSFDATDGNVEIVGSIPDGPMLEKELVGDMVSWNEELILTPLNAANIWRYNTENDTWSEVKIQNRINKERFFRSVHFGDKIFIIGYWYPCILVYDLVQNTISYLDHIFEEIPISDNAGFGYFRTEFSIVGEYLYLASCVTNIVVKINMGTCECEIIRVGSEKNTYSGIAYDGENFWLAPRKNGPIVKWNGEMTEEYLLPEGFGNNKFYFTGIIYDGERIVLPNRVDKKTLLLNVIGNKDYIVENEQYIFYRIINDGSIVSLSQSGVLKIIKCKEVIYNEKLLLSKEKLDTYYSKYNKLNNLTKEPLYENEYMDLQSFLKMI